MKRFAAFLLAMMMALSCVWTLAESASAEDAALPHIGEMVHGFEVMEVTAFPLINADVVYFVHQKTGAELIYLANDDTNRVFDLNFKTPAKDDKGIPHVFEHATLGGSEKYPSKELFFNLSYQTYNTYMNAGTYTHMTTYPVASLSEEQLLMYADYYADSCFNPMLHIDESIFTGEAWRYSMDSADSPLTIAGTVYSEMMGEWTIAIAAQKNFIRTLFPGAYAGNESGGVPAHIPEMTWQDVKDYHQAYYHPSNSLCCLYGDFADYARFLKLLDGYYSAYEKAEIVVTEDFLIPQVTDASAVYQFPAAAGSSTEKAAEVWYGFRVDVQDADTLNAVDLLATLLSFDAFPVMAKLKEALPSASCSVGTLIETPSPAIVFYASGMDEAEAEVFKATIDAALAEILQTGFDPEDVAAVASSYSMETRLMPESTSLGVDIVPTIAYYWASLGSWDSFMDYIASIDHFTRWNEDGTLLKALDRYLVSNEHHALAVTVPAPGQQNADAAALAEALAQQKSTMTEAEIAAIVAATHALEEGATGDAAQYVAQLQAVTVESLPEEVRVYDYTDVVGDDGVRRINMDANVDGVGQAMVLLNVADIPQDYLHWLQLYTDLLGEVDTKAHTREELSSLITRYLYDGVIKVSLPASDSTAVHVRAAWKATDEDLQGAYDLIRELLFDSKFTDGKRIAQVVSKLRTSRKLDMNGNIYMTQLYRAMRIGDETQNLYQYITDLDYYQFLCELEAALRQDPKAARRPLQTVQFLVNNSSGAVLGFAGSRESQALNQPIADAFIASLSSREVSATRFDIPVPARHEGIVADTNVQFNLLFATFEELGLSGYSGDLDAVTALVTDAFLMPLLRDQYGAYSVLHGASADGGVYLLSYRDPSIQETFDVYARLGELLAGYTVDQETLDGYILSSYANYAQPAGELAGAENAMLNVIAARPQDEPLAWMRALKALKAEDVAAYAGMYAKLSEVGVRSTAGGREKIEANADRFDAVLDPFKAVEGEESGFTDCGAEHPLYEAVRFAYDNGLMSPVAEDRFGVDDPVTLGEFAAAFSTLAGGPTDANGAINMLSQYLIIERKGAGTVLNRCDLGVAVGNFMYSIGLNIVGRTNMAAYTDASGIPGANVGDFSYMIDVGMFVPVSGDTLDLTTAATRGMLANMLNIFYNVVLAGQ